MKYCVSLAMLLLCGCGSPVGSPTPVTGKVTLNGTAVGGAKISFLSKNPKGRSASGETAADGSFTLTTFKTADGAIPGDYTITIAKYDASKEQETHVGEGVYGDDYGAMMDGAASGKGAADLYKNQIPEKYADPAQSGLERTVAESPPNEFDFDLK